ncbi:MAG: TatD family nuclease-associated radical SAM protein [Elusimicrobiaceae bacterium]|nr:TatD family nuclease-associated radical SAM protein [Elusimicrobiaceae bacterium]
MNKSSECVYRFKDAVYFNITNECPNSCVFCIKRKWDMQFMGHNLALGAPPPAEEIISALDAELKRAPAREAVFCGYGESTMRLETLLAVGRAAKALGLKLRLNTVGLGNLVNGRDITSDLAEVLDCISISLNSADPGQWKQLVRPLKKYEAEGFGSVLEFIRLCAAKIPETVVTAVEDPAVDMRLLEATAGQLGAKFRARPALGENGPEG